MSPYDELVAKFGTPLYVYDLNAVDAARRDLFAALPEEFELYYAVKANPHPDIIHELRVGGSRRCRAEISSSGELDAAVAGGYPGTACLYTGPGKTDEELHRAIAGGVRLFSVESITDLWHLGEVAGEQGVNVDFLLRLNASSGRAGSGARMTGRATQFGISETDLADQLSRLLSVPWTRFSGLHFFPMSNARDEASLVAEFEHTIATAARVERLYGLRLRHLDIGGGFRAPYAVRGKRPIYGDLRRQLVRAMDRYFPNRNETETRFACESGRYLVADAGTLLCRVRDVKVSGGRTFVVLDAGINALGGMSALGRLLPQSVEVTDSGTEQVSLAGPLCTPADLLGRSVQVPELGPGDIIAIPNVGAYGLTASLVAFLGRPAPIEVVTRGVEVVSVSRIRYERSYSDSAAPHTKC
ncbi:type III PLP-dependent enzyme [Frankia sp. B2]|uniref:type III PLP-dependent enzyme n=1 Tax=Frankia sp. B2 TaxID=2541730 RepID=UPI00106AC59A|nr:type III PLP-dependent enzyme [Frankia sp. B2]TFE31008.1 type III PLP-dependent enzyme [Frankia sp. B2]